MSFPEGFQTQLPQLTLIPRVVPGKHHHASAGGCILDCTVVLEPGEDRHQLPCAPCCIVHPTAVPSPFSTRQIPWLPMDLLVLAFLLVGGLVAGDWQEPDLSHGCARGSCYPATGNLLVGRATRLSATSTCGLDGPQEYCIVSHLQDSEKCFTCDSRDPSLPESHRIENVIYLSSPHDQRTWWQSENGVEHVSIRLDLEGEFHFTHLIMKFKTFRPAAMLVERSADFGRSWKVYRYFAYNCSKLFPGVPTHPLGRVDEVLCDQRYSEIEPSSHGEVIFKVLDPSIPVADPYSPEIQELLRVTNLRVNLTKLHTLGDNLLDSRREVLQKYYYAVDELVLRGSCFCHGHAAHCAPAPGAPTPSVPGMIHGRCVCEHHTQGLNCERCEDFYQDLPWRPAEGSSTNACRRCDCNEHSRRCHFDLAVFLATGNTSGGVCDDCQHNTMGRHCHLCKPFYYRHPRSDIRSPTACAPCDCDPAGSLDGGACDGHTDVALGMIAGQCRCKENVAGPRCDRCRHGAYGLSHSDPQGCQPCRCDPRGTVVGSSPCDPISGDCYCKRFVAGRSCNQCVPEFWGLSYDLGGCRPCACDFGGAYNNRCSMEDGACPCRPHIMGRQCDQVQPGFFCAPLDYYTYEAEQATGHGPSHSQLPGAIRAEVPQDCLEYDTREPAGRKGRSRHQPRAPQPPVPSRRSRQQPPKPDVEEVVRDGAGRMVTWTGSGFARVRDGAGLTFRVDNVPYPMDYELLLRYEPESAEDWEAVVSVSSRVLPTSSRCGNLLPSEQMYRESLPHSQRYVLLSRPFCFEPSTPYEVTMRLQRAGVTQRHPGAFILIDSLVLLPRVSELPGFHGAEAAARQEELERYQCLEVFRMAPPHPLAQACARLVCSISALMHGGALPCQCDPQGSLSSECQVQGGQCECKPHVIGRRCDRCSPGSYGFGPLGCSSCTCSPEGSVSQLCDQVSGQCRCQPGTVGRQCDQCQPSHWGFPACRPCQCNGHAEECDPRTGTCLRCRDHTSGRHCERCQDGYYGNPVLGSGQQCRPCPCPGYPGTRHYHGIACHADDETHHIVCLCAPGYAGPRCDRCSPGYFGAPETEGGECRPCQCNNNIDTSDPEGCDPRTGQCLRCLYHTAGPRCAQCQPGYYGNALQRSCRRCGCDPRGTLASHCTNGTCDCDRGTGACACRPNVVGKSCDRCAPHFWNLGGSRGCEPCGCHPTHALHPACDTVTGQCHCRPGFGGRVCSQCQEHHWGNPEQECRACECEPLGAESPQCEQDNGQCQCRLGFGGLRCDRCQRGYQEPFPHCSPCHPCFGHWDLAMGSLREGLQRLGAQVQALREGGSALPLSPRRLRELEEALGHVERLLGDGDSPVGPLLDGLPRQLGGTRMELDNFWKHLQEVERHLDQLVQADTQQHGQLAELSRELGGLNRTASHLQTLLSTVASAGFSESYRSILASLEASRQAEVVANGTAGELRRAQMTQRETERLLRQRGNTFRRGTAAARKSLREAQKRVMGLNITRINEKICGAPGDWSCEHASCGGALCRDSAGKRHCGGTGCAGALPISARALTSAQNASQQLEVALGQLGVVAQKMQEVQELARGARSRAEEALGRSQAARSRAEKATAQLRDFIRRIKAFLAEEGADPGSIELVARQVLNISLPSSPEQIQQLLWEMRESISQLEGVDAVLNSTAEGLAVARDLLAQGQEARERAEGIRDELVGTQQALEVARTQAMTARSTLQSARDAIQVAENRAKEAERSLRVLDRKESQAQRRLQELAQLITTLQESSQDARHMAQQAKDGAQRATTTSGMLSQDLAQVTQRYVVLKNRVGLLDRVSGGALQRVSQLMAEAQDLLDKASNSKRKLEDLEQRFGANERTMAAKVTRLQALEQQVTGLLQEIRERANAYATC
ncbi:PREDICTED: laminin subunit beta-2-like isoform X2 [Ficedula albicollis]|uniref:laminin subunit beta-2-like isoform X2 n=2 Tax=Ficedula albicollis TaxID=59894 RepID=UPI000359CC71|nr:PREDICTED: laminin subunit beta-2-like isoform X2 [Ficedula albicollis]